VVATQDARQSPERLGDNAHPFGWRGGWVVRRVAVSHRRHNERAIWTEDFYQRVDQSFRPAVHRPDRPERRMDNQYAT